ncbi:MAG: rod shape-determining protein RodA [Candidatus Kerfeldbacteria bacterium]|nr:rod shape-determining protein RodA [Candidatus Kerfeldbacteria bacterium]
MFGATTQFLRKIDWILLLSIGTLLIIGSLTQYSLSIEPGVVISEKMVRQLVYVGLAIIVFFVASFINYRVYITRPAVSVICMVVLLLAVLMFGREFNGATGWIIIGPLSTQPVELVKLLFIIFFATIIRRRGERQEHMSYENIVVTGGVTALILLLIFQQPDLGSAFIIFCVWVGLLALARAPKLVIAGVLLIAVLAGVIGWFFVFQPYQKDRLSIFLNRSSDPLGTGYNITQSIIAVGSGGLWGKGFGEGTQSQLQFLPEASSDFAFAVVAEEFGFVGATLVIVSLFMLCFRLIRTMQTSSDTFVFFFCGGVVVYMLAQSVVVIGMNMGIMPVTGLPLPFISSGGSSLLTTAAMCGIAHSMWIRG